MKATFPHAVRPLPPAAHATAAAILICAVSWASVIASGIGDGVALWWPAAGVAVVAVVTATKGARPWVVAVVLLASALGNILAGRPLTVSLLFGLANAAEAAVAAWWLLRGTQGRPGLTTLPDLWRLLVAAVLGATVISLGATATVVIVMDGSVWPTLLHALASHASAVLLITPLAMRQPQERTGAGRIEVMAQVALVALTTVLVFGSAPRLSLAFLLLMPLLWGAMRMPLRAVTLEVSAALALALTLTAVGFGSLGPLTDIAGVTEVGQDRSLTEFVLVQVYVVSTFAIVLSLAITVSQRRALLTRIAGSERILRGGFEDALLGTVILRDGDHGLQVVEINAVAADLLGMDQGDSTWDRMLGAQAAPLAMLLSDVASGRRASLRDEVELASGDDEPRWADIAASPLADEPGLLVLQLVETTSQRRAERDLEHLAIHDTLTGLPNRTLLHDRLERAVVTSERSGELVTVLLLDLDDFKRVNDTHGHAVGDEILRDLADRLVSVVRTGDTVARLGGDEFVIVMPGADESIVDTLASRLRAVFEEPFTTTSGSFRLTASMGITGGAPGSSAEELLRDADTAMYVSKAEGRGVVTWFNPSFHERAVHNARMSAEFEGAIERGEIVLFAQPIVDLATGRIAAAETLVRWRHPERGLLAPDRWLDIAIAGPFGQQLEGWILNESCRILADWCRRWREDCPTLHVNVSRAMIMRGDLAEQVRSALAADEVPAEKLVVELTETDLESVRGSLTSELEQLRAAGVRIAVDDFGTGYSALSRLARLPLDELKIDQAFVADMLVDARSHAIVSAVISLSQALNLGIVAEGVETPEQARHLEGLGCPRGQGYLWSRPVPLEELTQRIAVERA